MSKARHFRRLREAQRARLVSDTPSAEPIGASKDFDKAVYTENAPLVERITKKDYVPMPQMPERVSMLEPEAVTTPDIPEITIEKVELPEVELPELEMPEYEASSSFASILDENDNNISSVSDVEPANVADFDDVELSDDIEGEYESWFDNLAGDVSNSRWHKFDETYNLDDESRLRFSAGLRTRGVNPYAQIKAEYTGGDTLASGTLQCRIGDQCNVKLLAEYELSSGDIRNPDITARYESEVIASELPDALWRNSRYTITKHDLMGEDNLDGSVYYFEDKVGVKVEYDRTLYEMDSGSTIEFSGGVGIDGIGTTNEFNYSAGVFYKTSMDLGFEYAQEADIKLGYGMFKGDNFGESLQLENDSNDMTHGFILKVKI